MITKRKYELNNTRIHLYIPNAKYQKLEKIAQDEIMKKIPRNKRYNPINNLIQNLVNEIIETEMEMNK